MERRVKERLIGATILVVLVVMFVPEFLSGPRTPAVPAEAQRSSSARTYRVDIDHIATAPPAPAAPGADTLAAEPAPSASVPTIARAPAIAPAPPSATTTAAPAQPSAAAAPSAAPSAAATPMPVRKLQLPPRPAPAAKPAPPPRAVPVPASSAGWSVQVGSFASKANSDNFVRQLKAEGFSVYVSPIGAAAATRYRVRLGPFAERAAAAGIMARLQAQKHASTLVPPNE